MLLTPPLPSPLAGKEVKDAQQLLVRTDPSGHQHIQGYTANTLTPADDTGVGGAGLAGWSGWQCCCCAAVARVLCCCGAAAVLLLPQCWGSGCDDLQQHTSCILFAACLATSRAG